MTLRYVTARQRLGSSAGLSSVSASFGSEGATWNQVYNAHPEWSTKQGTSIRFLIFQLQSLEATAIPAQAGGNMKVSITATFSDVFRNPSAMSRRKSKMASTDVPMNVRIAQLGEKSEIMPKTWYDRACSI
mmetsp:Transcript_37814/g.68350  ORF Transcript_37814/g.68350 Transcript_37814/m.68350 type:complete len:131 (-) Transcript_37814:444-836(-)